MDSVGERREFQRKAAVSIILIDQIAVVAKARIGGDARDGGDANRRAGAGRN